MKKDFRICLGETTIVGTYSNECGNSNSESMHIRVVYWRRGVVSSDAEVDMDINNVDDAHVFKKIYQETFERYLGSSCKSVLRQVYYQIKDEGDYPISEEFNV